MTDLISRQAAIDALMEILDRPNHAEFLYTDEICGVLGSLPSADPQWIPVSERLPEEHEWFGTEEFGTTISDEVFVTFESPKGERFCKHLCFQNGKISRYDQSSINVWHKGAIPIAWKPFPKPYEGDKK